MSSFARMDNAGARADDQAEVKDDQDVQDINVGKDGKGTEEGFEECDDGQDDDGTDVESGAEEVNVTQVMSLERTQDEQNEFWKTHENWKVDVIAREMSVEVGDPVQGSRTIMNPNPPVTYRVSTIPTNSTVRRRYSDFDWLREVLQINYLGMLVAPLPAKRAVGNKSGTFLKLRAHGLTMFIQRILRNPYVKSDATVQAFLTIPEGAEWDAYKKANTPAKDSLNPLGTEPGNLGKDRWNEALRAYRIPERDGDIINSVRAELDFLESLLNALAQSSDKVVSAAQAYSSALGNLDAKFAKQYSTRAVNHDPAFKPIHESLARLGGTFSNWHTTEEDYFEVLENVLYQAMKQQLCEVTELKRLFDARDAIYASKVKISNSLLKLEEEKSVAEAQGRYEKSSKLGEKVVQQSDKLNATQAKLQIITKGLFFSEVDLFVSNKVKELENLRSMLATASLAHLENMNTLWKKTLQ
mmetsp:Transcript_13512/g.29060  ORF Transcript_13512/g.29060 Transcript_13512/m.29060 type:complete len:470 (+) Transcript_13512:39-1448(+)